MSTWLYIARLAKRSLIILALSVAIAIGVYLEFDVYVTGLGADLVQLQQSETENKANLLKRQFELESMQTRMDQFNALRGQGLVGEAGRVGWVEQLLLSRESLGLPDTLTYTLLAPKPFSAQGGTFVTTAPSPSDPATVVDPEFHDLNIVISGIHEEELLMFLKDFQVRVKGRFRVNACTLSDRNEVGLSAHCTLRFFTLADGSRK
jgi:hypothetical protein